MKLVLVHDELMKDVKQLPEFLREEVRRSFCSELFQHLQENLCRPLRPWHLLTQIQLTHHCVYLNPLRFQPCLLNNSVR